MPGLFGPPPNQRKRGVQFNMGEAGFENAAPKQDKTKRIIGIIGDTLLGLGGQPGVYGPMMEERRAMEQRLRAQRQLAEQQRQWENADWMSRKKWEMANKPPEWGYEQDNAGNVHRYDKQSGVFDPKPVFIDPNPQIYMQDGQVVRVPNMYSPSGPKPGETVDGFTFKGGDPNDKNNWAPVVASQPPGQAERVKAQLIQKFGPGPRAESEYQKWLQSFGGGVSGNAGGNFP